MKNRKWLRILFFLLPVITILPFVVKYAANKILSRLPGFYGHVKQIRFSLFPASIKMQGFFLDRINEKKERALFLAAETIRITFSWKALWKGAFVCDIGVDAPVFTFLRENKKDGKLDMQPAAMNPGIELIIEKLQLTRGKLEFIDLVSAPVIALDIRNIEVLANNIPGIPDKHNPLPTNVHVKAEVCGGTFHANLKADFMEVRPKFDLSAEVADIDMVNLNDLFRAYGKFDVSKGTLGLYTEVAANDGAFSGYVESVMMDVEVLGPEDKGDNLLRLLWEGIVGAVVEIFDDKNDEISAKIPFNGNFKNAEIHLWSAVVEVLSNAFVHGLRPTLKRHLSFNQQS